MDSENNIETKGNATVTVAKGTEKLDIGGKELKAMAKASRAAKVVRTFETNRHKRRAEAAAKRKGQALR